MRTLKVVHFVATWILPFLLYLAIHKAVPEMTGWPLGLLVAIYLNGALAGAVGMALEQDKEGAQR